MTEPAGVTPLGPCTTGRDLSARAAVLATRLADVLVASCSPESAAPATVAFLRGWAEAAGPVGPPLSDAPVDRLVAAFELTGRERDLLLLAGLAEEHEGLADTFRSLHPQAVPRPSVGLAALVLGDGTNDLRPRLRRLLTEGRLVRHHLLAVDGDGPLFERVLLPAEALWPVLHGADAWPASQTRIAVPPVAPGLDQWLARLPSARAVAALRSRRPLTVLVQSEDVTVALSRCAALAAAAGRTTVAASVTPGDSTGVALLLSHAAARGAVPVLAPVGDGPLHLGAAPGPVLVCGGSAHVVGSRPVLTIAAGPIGVQARRIAWTRALPALADHAATLAVRHPVDPAFLREVVADVRAQEVLDGVPPGVREVSDIIRSRAGAALPPGVELRTPAVAWDRLVLPADPAAQLREAVARLEHAAVVLDGWGLLGSARARRGVRLLFSGPPGTGKSLAAEVVAGAAATDLLIADVSQVMSKWVGETEKHLAAIFDAAEQTQAVLLLDEADALFGARTAGSDAQDRYVNLHSAYLLQRLDHFDGLAVLTTNLRHNIDAAFIRRVDFVVEFPPPAEADRVRLWELHLPEHPGAVAADVDVVMLARLYPVPGAAIRNAAIAAAFVAASEGAPIHQRHLVQAVRREYAKAVQPFPGEPPVAVGYNEERA